MASMTTARGGPATTSHGPATPTPVRARQVAVRTVGRPRPDSGRLSGLPRRRRPEVGHRRGWSLLTTRAADSGGDLDVDDDRLKGRNVPDSFTAGGSSAASPGSIQKGSSASRRARPLGGFDGDEDESDALIVQRPSTEAVDASTTKTEREFPAWEPKFPRSVDDLGAQWRSMPSRYRILLGTCCAFVLCNMDKVNISVAIIPMAKDMGWSVGTAGLLQSAFFYGFALSQLPGGYLATKFGGARMLPIGVFIWSAATMAVPFVAGDTRALFISRVFVGLGEGISPAAATDVIARSVPLKERGRAVAFVFNGFNIGSVLGLSASPLIIEAFGWKTVFEVFGALGLVWVVSVGLGIYARGGASPGTDPETKGDLAPVLGLSGQRELEPGQDASDGVPWKEIFAATPLRALAYVHFCNNWGFYVLLAWLPSYFTQELGVNLTNASLFTLLPPLGSGLVASAVGPLADNLLEKGWEVSRVRKTAQTIAFLGPATAMVAAAAVDDPRLTVGFLTCGLSLASFSYAGLYCNHQDMSPRYSSILLGMTNTVGAFPGVIGVPLTGYLLEKTDNWEVSMFLPAVFFYVTGVAVFTKWGSAEKQSWG